jgi:hypothetical protein
MFALANKSFSGLRRTRCADSADESRHSRGRLVGKGRLPGIACKYTRSAARSRRGGGLWRRSMIIERKRSSGKVRHVRIMAVSVVAACAICAFAAANASAALPEWGKCVKVPVTIKGKEHTKGKYANSNCTEKTGGEYEFVGGTEGLTGGKEFTNTMTTPEAALETSRGIRVSCSAQTATGDLSGTKEVSEVRVTFTGCHLTTLLVGWTCENEFVENHKYVEGTIVTRKLKGKLGYISGKGTASPVVGLELEPEVKQTPFAIFGCGEPGFASPVIFSEVGRKPRGANGGDSIISPISPVNTMGTQTTQVYLEKKVENPETHELEAVKGVQEPSSFENGKPDFLESQTFNGFGELGWEGASQEETAVTKLNSGEELEIKA